MFLRYQENTPRQRFCCPCCFCDACHVVETDLASPMDKSFIVPVNKFKKLIFKNTQNNLIASSIIKSGACSIFFACLATRSKVLIWSHRITPVVCKPVPNKLTEKPFCLAKAPPFVIGSNNCCTSQGIEFFRA